MAVRGVEDFELSEIVEPLLTWFSGHARVLPWRSDPTPYKVWVSEIMLQQTRVEAVKPYFERFLDALPDIRSLADCPEDTLLKLWEGLGYYNRVRNLQTAARQILSEYGGEMPSNYAELLKLKGIGHYTAGAIASIAFGGRVAAVDGNVLRVLTRLTADATDIGKQSFRTKLEDILAEIMPEGRCGEFNQALMELGATVCVPNGEPKCAECPWGSLCRAHKNGSETSYPVKSKPKDRRKEEKTVLLIRDGDRIVLQKRPEKGLLAGLYEFPTGEGYLSEEEAVEAVKDLGFLPLRIQKLRDAKHIFSHVEWHMKGFMVRVEATEDAPEGLFLVDKEQTESDFPVPAAYAAYMEAMDIEVGMKRARNKEERRYPLASPVSYEKD